MRITLAARHQLTQFTDEFIFTAPTRLAFQPGQFVMLKKSGDEQKNARAFSIASAPNDNTLTFIMKRLVGGVISGFLSIEPLGVEIDCGPALGRFILNPADTARIYVAAGTGLAPIMSFLEWEKIQNENKITIPPALLIFGEHDETHLFWTNRLPKNSLITLSIPSAAWTGLRGRVTAHTAALLEKNPTAAWYLCGNPEMVKEVRAQLLASGVADIKIHFEIY